MAQTFDLEDLWDHGYITGGTLSFPNASGETICLHKTGHGFLFSVGDRYSSKLVETWDEPPTMYDIYTNDAIGQLDCPVFEEYRDVLEYMKAHGQLHLEVANERIALIIKDHYAPRMARVETSLS